MIKLKKSPVKKAKIKERNSSEYYKSQIRELEKENRSLRKQLKQLEKMESNFHKVLDEPNEEKEDSPIKCSACGKGTLSVLIIGPRVITTCDLCLVRKVSKSG